MTRDDIIKLAIQVGFGAYHAPQLERFAALVAAAEREACAEVCEKLRTPSYLSISEGSVWDTGTLMCADAIRARGQE